MPIVDLNSLDLRLPAMSSGETYAQRHRPLRLTSEDNETSFTTSNVSRMLCCARPAEGNVRLYTKLAEAIVTHRKNRA